MLVLGGAFNQRCLSNKGSVKVLNPRGGLALKAKSFQTYKGDHSSRLYPSFLEEKKAQPKCLRALMLS